MALAALVLRARRNGWFVAGPAGGFPFPFEWQAWAMTAGWFAAIIGGLWLPDELAWLLQIGVTIAYIGASMWMVDDRIG